MGYVYILASQSYGTLYVGVTNDLVRRVYEHKQELTEGFTKKYGVKILVYYECYENMATAISYEKKLKHFGRQRKLDMIEKFNPTWEDLYNDII